MNFAEAKKKSNPAEFIAEREKDLPGSKLVFHTVLKSMLSKKSKQRKDFFSAAGEMTADMRKLHDQELDYITTSA